MVPASLDFWRANLNLSASSSGTSMPSESLKPTARLPPSSSAVHDVDGQAALVEDVVQAGAVDLEGGRLERRRRDDDVAFVLRGCVATRSTSLLAPRRRLDGEGVVVLVLEVAGLVGPQAGERVGDGRRLQPVGRDVLEVDGVRHGSSWMCGPVTLAVTRTARGARPHPAAQTNLRPAPTTNTATVTAVVEAVARSMALRHAVCSTAGSAELHAGAHDGDQQAHRRRCRRTHRQSAQNAHVHSRCLCRSRRAATQMLSAAAGPVLRGGRSELPGDAGPSAAAPDGAAPGAGRSPAQARGSGTVAPRWMVLIPVAEAPSGGLGQEVAQRGGEDRVVVVVDRVWSAAGRPARPGRRPAGRPW